MYFYCVEQWCRLAKLATRTLTLATVCIRRARGSARVTAATRPRQTRSRVSATSTERLATNSLSSRPTSPMATRSGTTTTATKVGENTCKLR